jgi:hypothetical protein
LKLIWRGGGGSIVSRSFQDMNVEGTRIFIFTGADPVPVRIAIRIKSSRVYSDFGKPLPTLYDRRKIFIPKGAL